MKTEIVKFNGSDLACVVTDSGQVMVAIKPICEGIGLNVQSQYEAIKNDDVLNELYGVHHIVASDGKNREMNCLPLEFLYGWLFQVKFTNTMSDETKSKLIAYKKECYKALANHFFGNVKKQIETNEMEIKLLEELNNFSSIKNEVSAIIREKKSLLDKIRAERLNNEPTLFQ